MPFLSTSEKIVLIEAVCTLRGGLGRNPSVTTKTEKIIGLIGCALCFGGLGSWGVNLVKALFESPAVNQVQQAPAQRRNIKTPPTSSLTERVLANRNGGIRAGFITLISKSGQEKRKTFDRSPQKEVEKELKDSQYEQYCQDYNLV